MSTGERIAAITPHEGMSSRLVPPQFQSVVNEDGLTELWVWVGVGRRLYQDDCGA